MALGSVESQDRRRVMWCGDFNAHSTLWGGSQSYVNGKSGNESGLDLTLISSSMAGRYSWEESTGGSDNYPIMCTVEMRVLRYSRKFDGYLGK